MGTFESHLHEVPFSGLYPVIVWRCWASLCLPPPALLQQASGSVDSAELLFLQEH